jgi:proteasome accessory factor B
MGMSNQKTERLLNLTMALLASKRFLSKAEIFEKVAGYSGSEETKERMFERDKDDLRLLGISILVGTDDPFFQDEQGYRILESDYELKLGDLTPSELSYLSLAATIWRNQLFSTSGSVALLKLDALSGAGAREDFGNSTLSLENETPLFPALWEAIIEQKNISFTYRSTSVTTRKLSPFGLTLWHGSWYLVGQDLEKQEIRVFKVSRIVSEIDFSSTGSAFSVPEDFSISAHLIMLHPESNTHFIARLRVGRCQKLRAGAKVTNIDSEWDRAQFSLGSNWLEQILWFGADIALEGPESNVKELREALRVKL